MKPASEKANIIWTIGHSTRALEDFINLLKNYGINIVIDIRTVPRSRTNPQFNRETLPSELGKAGVDYLHIAGLGGLRRPAPNSPNKGWRVPSFRGYADYMQTEEFEQKLNELIKISRSAHIALMCAEAVPWRCHRSLVADSLTIRGIRVEHIMSLTSHHSHKLTPWAKVDGFHITYPPESISAQL